MAAASSGCPATGIFIVRTGETVEGRLQVTASDADGDPLTYAVVNGPAKGSLSGGPPNLIYTPNAAFSGSDSFTFQAKDSVTLSNLATVFITVAPPTPSPIATDGSESQTFSGGTGWSAPWTVSGMSRFEPTKMGLMGPAAT